MSKLGLIIGLAVTAAAAPASGQVRLGGEFLVNSYTVGDQRYPAIAADTDGNFVVVWVGNETGDASLFGRRYDAAGNPLTDAFQVGADTTFDQVAPSVAFGADGHFLVAWSGVTPDRGCCRVFARRYDAFGTPLGAELTVSTFTTGYQTYPAVSSDADGNFVVVWMSRTPYGIGEDGDSAGVFGRRYDAVGNPRGEQFQINSYWTYWQGDPAVASDASGGFVVVWESSQTTTSILRFGVVGQRFDASGARIGEEFVVSLGNYHNVGRPDPALASNAAGDFVVVWAGPQSDYANAIYARRYSDSGSPQGPEFAVSPLEYNTRTGGVSSDPEGNFVVVWSRGDGYYVKESVFGHRFDASGAPKGGEFQVNTYTTFDQDLPAVAASANGRFVVAWQGNDGNGAGVVGQRFAGDLVFTDGFEADGVGSPAEADSAR